MISPTISWGNPGDEPQNTTLEQCQQISMKLAAPPRGLAPHKRRQLYTRVDVFSARPATKPIEESRNPITTISLSDLARRNPSDYSKHLGKVLRVNDQIGGDESIQQVLPLASFDRHEQNLIRKLASLRHSPKVERMSAKAEYHRTMAAEARRKKRAEDRGETITDSESSIRGWAKEEAEEYYRMRKGAEIGAWRFILKSGKVITMIHHSSHNKGVLMATALTKKGVTLDQIAYVQYFHTHTSTEVPVLSPSDIKYRRIFQEEWGVPVHMYAIAEIDAQIFVGHTGP